MSKILNLISILANGTGTAPTDTAKTNTVGGWLQNTVLPLLQKAGDSIMNWFMTFFVKIVQFMLRIVDFLQFFVGRLAGIDTWSAKGDVGNVRLADTDVIFRFLLSKSVTRAFIAILGVSVVLLIIFTIIAIVKTDYSAAVDTDGKADGNKSKVLKKAGQSLFVMLIVPFILVFGILGSNAILASLNNALKGNSTISMGGQIFSASSYEANRYRKYAEAGVRVPVDFGTDVIRHVYVPEKGYDALGGLVRAGDPDAKTPYLFVAPMGYEEGEHAFGLATIIIASAAGSTNHATATLYKLKTGRTWYGTGEFGTCGMTLDDFEEVGFSSWERSMGFAHLGIWSEASGSTEEEYYIKNEFLSDAQKALGTSSKSADYTMFKTLPNGFLHLPELTVDGKLLSYVKDEGELTMYSLGYMGESAKTRNIIHAVYESWEYNKTVYSKYNNGKNSYNVVNFENAYEATYLQNVKTLAGGSADNATRSDLISFKNIDTAYDGKFVPIQAEYYVMADFMDYALEHAISFYFVNSSNPLIEWRANAELGTNGVNTKYLTASNEFIKTLEKSLEEVESKLKHYQSIQNSGNEDEVKQRLQAQFDVIIDNIKKKKDKDVSWYNFEIKRCKNLKDPVSEMIKEDYPKKVAAIEATAQEQIAFYENCKQNLTGNLNQLIADCQALKEKLTVNANGELLGGYGGGFIVEYANGINRLYESVPDANSELDGETFIVCTKVGDYYIPITQADSRSKGFVSSYLAEDYRGVIVARGVFDENGNPTYITKTDSRNSTDIGYYELIGTGGALSGSVDNIDGLTDQYQPASGVLMPYAVDGKTPINAAISFTHVKVDEYYEENGLEYIKLHFYELVGDDNNDRNYRYVFSAQVIGTFDESKGYYTSSVFDSTTVYTVSGQVFSAKSTEIIMDNTIEYIYFNRTDMSRNLTLDFAMGLNGFSSLFDKGAGDFAYFRFKLGCVYDFDANTVYHLSNGSALIDYNFMEKDGIGLTYLYRPGDLNIIILLFATILIFTVLAQAVWGLIARIYEIVLMFIIYPGFASSIPLDDGSRFKKWRENVVKKVLGAYGVILGINIFFILLPVVREATYIFKAEDIPAALQGRSFFGNADFLNRIVYIMFLLVLFTLIKTLPGLIAGLVGGDDVYADGGKVKENVDKSVKAVSDVVSGRKILQTASKAKELAGGFIPGKAIADIPAHWAKEKTKEAWKNRKEKKAEKAAQQDAKYRGGQAAEALEAEKAKLAEKESGASSAAAPVAGVLDTDMIKNAKDGLSMLRNIDMNNFGPDLAVYANDLLKGTGISVGDDGKLTKNGKNISLEEADAAIEEQRIKQIAGEVAAAKDKELEAKMKQGDEITAQKAVVGDAEVKAAIAEKGADAFNSSAEYVAAAKAADKARMNDPRNRATAKADDKEDKIRGHVNAAQHLLGAVGFGGAVDSWKNYRIERYRVKQEKKGQKRFDRKQKYVDMFGKLTSKLTRKGADGQKLEPSKAQKNLKKALAVLFPEISVPVAMFKKMKSNHSKMMGKLEESRIKSLEKRVNRPAAWPPLQDSLYKQTNAGVHELRKLYKKGKLVETLGEEAAKAVAARLNNMRLGKYIRKDKYLINELGKEVTRKNRKANKTEIAKGIRAASRDAKAEFKKQHKQDMGAIKRVNAGRNAKREEFTKQAAARSQAGVISKETQAEMTKTIAANLNKNMQELERKIKTANIKGTKAAQNTYKKISTEIKSLQDKFANIQKDLAANKLDIMTANSQMRTINATMTKYTEMLRKASRSKKQVDTSEIDPDSHS